MALLRMHREGLIELPAPRHKVNPVHAQLRYFASAGERVVGLFGFGAVA